MTVDLPRLTRTLRDLTSPHRDGLHESPGLLIELQTVDQKVLRGGSGGPIPSGKPGSRPPGDLGQIDLLRHVEAKTYEHEADLLDLLSPYPVTVEGWYSWRDRARPGWITLLGNLHQLVTPIDVDEDDTPATVALWDDASKWRRTARLLLGHTGRDHGDTICPACQAPTYVTAGGEADEGYCLTRSCTRAASNAPLPKGLLTTEEAALLAGVSTATLRDWKRQHVLEPAGGSVRKPLWDPEQVKAAAAAPKPRAPKQTVPWRVQHVLDNPGHTTTEGLMQPPRCETCGESSPFTRALAV